jgi:hypothetical protein
MLKGLLDEKLELNKLPVFINIFSPFVKNFQKESFTNIYSVYGVGVVGIGFIVTDSRNLFSADGSTTCVDDVGVITGFSGNFPKANHLVKGGILFRLLLKNTV